MAVPRRVPGCGRGTMPTQLINFEQDNLRTALEQRFQEEQRFRERPSGLEVGEAKDRPLASCALSVPEASLDPLVTIDAGGMIGDVCRPIVNRSPPAPDKVWNGQ